MQINRQEEVAKGLFAINTRKRGWYLNAQKPGMICRMAGESGQDLGKARQGKNSLPFPSLPFPSPLTHQHVNSHHQQPKPQLKPPPSPPQPSLCPPPCRPPRRAPNPTLDRHLASSGRLSDPTHWPLSLTNRSSSNIGRTHYSTALPSAPTAGGNAKTEPTPVCS